MRPNIGIVSYCDHPRTLASVNHELYASRNGYTYIYDIAPTRRRRFEAKVEKIQKFLPLFDWVFWIDDDAFFLQPDVRLESFLDLAPTSSVIFCESPVNEGKWTWLSSGNFFIRNTPESFRLLEEVLATDLDDVSAWWDPSTYGYYTKGDQDAFVYRLASDESFSAPGFLTRLPYERFNTRPFHFTDSADEHFLVHFTGGDKHGQADAFGRRFGLTPALVPQAALDALSGVHYPVTARPASQGPQEPTPVERVAEPTRQARSILRPWTRRTRERD